MIVVFVDPFVVVVVVAFAVAVVDVVASYSSSPFDVDGCVIYIDDCHRQHFDRHRLHSLLMW